MLIDRVQNTTSVLTSALLCFRHPDKNKNPGAEDKFIQISKAYEVCGQASDASFSASETCLNDL